MASPGVDQHAGERSLTGWSRGFETNQQLAALDRIAPGDDFGRDRLGVD
jgi:hypothetical protein